MLSVVEDDHPDLLFDSADGGSACLPIRDAALHLHVIHRHLKNHLRLLVVNKDIQEAIAHQIAKKLNNLFVKS